MRGTEKQIVWANEIIETVVAIFEDAESFYRASNAPEEIKTANIEACRARAEAIKAADYAGDVIDIFGSIRRTGNVVNDISKLVARYKTAFTGSDSRKKILCK